jgi:hypothetical protein
MKSHVSSGGTIVAAAFMPRTWAEDANAASRSDAAWHRRGGVGSVAAGSIGVSRPRYMA